MSAEHSQPRKSPLLERTRQLMRARHMSIRTETAYLRWIEEFLRFHRDRCGKWVHPAEMGLKDVDFERFQITVRDGKGEKDRMVPLPRRLIDGLQRQVKIVRDLHEKDLAVGAGWVWLPYALAEKYPAAGQSIRLCPTKGSDRSDPLPTVVCKFVV